MSFDDLLQALAVLDVCIRVTKNGRIACVGTVPPEIKIWVYLYSTELVTYLKARHYHAEELVTLPEIDEVIL